MEKEEKFIGYYSAKAAVYGTCFYLNAAGEEIEVTAVCKPGKEENYAWQDKVCLGEVGKWIRVGRPRYNPYKICLY